MVLKNTMKHSPTVVAFHERKPKVETKAEPKPRPIRPPVLDGRPPTRQQLQQAMKVIGTLLLNDEMTERMFSYHTIEGLSMLLRPTPGLSEEKIRDLIWLRRCWNNILDDIQKISG